MYCMYCGNKHSDNDNFCAYCGHKISYQSYDDVSEDKRKISLELISLITGILAFCYFRLPFIGLPLAILSIIYGIKDMKERNRFSSGIVFGGMSIIFIVCYIVFLFVLFKNVLINRNDSENRNNNWYNSYEEHSHNGYL